MDGKDDRVEMPIEQLERLIDERIAEFFTERDIEFDDVSDDKVRLSRRGMIGALGLSAGMGALDSNPGSLDRQIGSRRDTTFDFSVPELEAEHIRADRIDSPNVNDIRYAETADDIQPAIDELAEHNSDGSCGGVVKLRPKVYKPETTIWLKKGVMLEGVRPSRYTNRRDQRDIRTTVLSTANLDNQHTFEHNADHEHPHYPVVANYRTPPLELAHRDPTEEELRYWGHNVGLKDIVIDGSAKKRWSNKTYFGVYDATLFSRSHNLYLENVETRGFEGYGGFIIGCKNVRDLGGKWRGGATDFHCSAYALHTAYPPDPTVYTEGIFDVEVIGPPPTMDLLTHDIKFVSGGWSQAKIKATERRFIGDEEDYWNGNAPITDPEDGKTIVKWEHGNLNMTGYTIEGYNRENDGFWCLDNHAYLRNVTVKNVRKAFRHNGRVPAGLSDCRIANSDIGISAESHIPNVTNIQIDNTDVGIDLDGTANQYGTIDGLVCENVGVGIRGTNNSQVVLNHPDFRGCDTAIEENFGQLEIHDGISI